MSLIALNDLSFIASESTTVINFILPSAFEVEMNELSKVV